MSASSHPRPATPNEMCCRTLAAVCMAGRSSVGQSMWVGGGEG